MRSYAIAGLSGSGKTTVREYADRSGYDTVSVGDVVRREYRGRNTDRSIGEFVLRAHEEEGRAVFVRKALERLDPGEGEGANGVVVEGVHSMAAAGAVRDRFGRTDVVYVWAPFSQRLRRCRQRDGSQTPRGLLCRDLRELNSGMAELASSLGHQHFVRNDETLEALESRLASVLD